MPEILNFHAFCLSQAERLIGAFPEMRFIPASGMNEIANWLEAKSAGDRAKAAALITEVTEFEQIPKISDMNAVWNRLFPPPERKADPHCEACSGTGFRFVERGGATGVARCTCGLPPAADARLEYPAVKLGIRKGML